MTDDSRDLKIAMSYLQDVENGIGNIEQEENYFIAAKEGDRIETGDWKLAMNRIEKAVAAGTDVDEIKARAYYVLGNLSLAVVQGFPMRMREKEPEAGDWIKRTINAFNQSVQLHPTPEAWFNLGIAWIQANNNAHALQCLQQAEAADNEDLSIKASKMIDRIQA